MSREDGIVDWIRDGLRRFSGELSGCRVILFGSRAAGRARHLSDFDLGIVGEQPVPLSVFHRIGDFLDSLPTLYRIDWVDLNRSSASLRQNAMNKHVVLYE
jgi:predicted nucleotidyltransferase